MISLPLTPSQLHIWKSQAISPDKPLFNQIVTAHLIPGQISINEEPILIAAWNQVQAIHRVLGSVIVAADHASPEQQFSDAVHTMDIVDLTAVPGDHHQILKNWIKERGKHLFKIDQAMTDAVLIRWGDNQRTVFLNMHHLIVDALSTQWVLQTLFTQFERLRANSSNAQLTSSAAEPIEQFSAYSKAQHDSINSNNQVGAVSPDLTAGVAASLEPPSIVVATSRENSYGGDTTPTLQSQPAPARCAFYGRDNNFPITDSIRKPIALATDEYLAISNLAKTTELKQFNNNLFLMCFHTTALVLYLHKVTGDDVIVMEAPLSGRFEAQWKRVVGNLIEMVRFEIDVSGADSLLALYQRVRDSVIATLRNAHSGSTRSITSGRVHGVINMIAHEPIEASELVERIDWHHSGHSDTHHPLRLHVTDWNATGTPVLDIDLNRGFFPTSIQDRACAHLHAAYKALIASRATLISNVDLLAPNELWYLSGKACEIPSQGFVALPESVEAICLHSPDAIAVCDLSQQLSYQDLHRQIVQVERSLRSIEIGGGKRVAVVMRRGIYLPAVLLGILRTGASYVPVDHTLPYARVKQILDDADVSCVIIDSPTQNVGREKSGWNCNTVLLANDLLTANHPSERNTSTHADVSTRHPANETISATVGSSTGDSELHPTGKPVSESNSKPQHDLTEKSKYVSEVRSRSAREPTGNSESVIIGQSVSESTSKSGNSSATLFTNDLSSLQGPAAGEPAYMIFTSGSTGKPKGVVVSHGALMSYLNWANEYYALDVPIVMPFHTSIGFDMTITSLFLPLVNGGTVKVFSEQGDATGGDALVLFDVLKDTQVNTVKLTPSHLSLLFNTSVTNACVKQLIVGGEDLKSSVARDAAGRFGKNVRIINEYGPTEATVGCVVAQWNDTVYGTSVPIGVPIHGMCAYVLNENRLPQYEGVIGELYLSGNSLANGYWQNSEQTADAFVENPWMSGARMYRTGDLVRIENQQLMYLGRTDSQIQRNGYRIELAEIEATIAGHPEVSDCALVMDEPSTDTTRLPDQRLPETSAETHCKLCGLSSLHPQGTLNEESHCLLCASFEPNRKRINDYFKDTDALKELVRKIQHERRGQYDAVVLLSGGKDSTYAIARLVDLGLKVYAFSLDNGFISDQAKDNINSVCQRLGIDHVYATTEHMNDIFVDSLTRYSNVCHGCFKTIYNLSMQFAEQHQIHYIFTGLSRGQLFETRLSNELFSDKTLPISKIDGMVQAARIQYHAVADAPNQLLAVESVNSGALPEKISIVDFYRYCHVELSDMIDYLQTRVGWVRPPDTGRSTNCLINDVGIYVHKLEQGFHNYSLPYSWDVRLGHKQRHEALKELDDDIDIRRVNNILESIGYQPTPASQQQAQLRAYVTGSDSLTSTDIDTWIESQLPAYMHPNTISVVEALPLNASGKIDRKQLSQQHSTAINVSGSELMSTTESLIANIWSRYVSTEINGRNADFFKSGGDSLSAIRCVVELRRLGYPVEPVDLFRTPRLCDFVKRMNLIPIVKQQAPPSMPSEKFSALDISQREKLSKILLRKKTQHRN